MGLLELFSLPGTWVGIASLGIMLVVLDIDNVIFMSILILKLPPHQEDRARKLGLLIGLILRVIMLFGIGLLAQMKSDLFSIPYYNVPISVKDLIVLGGGLFLMTKSIKEIHEKLEGEAGEADKNTKVSFWSIIAQVTLLNMIFSVDSVITAVGMVNSELALSDKMAIMVIAMSISMLLMYFFAIPLSKFVHIHPTMKILALAFLILIGFMLVIEGLHNEIPKGYIYFAMLFALGVELINIRVRKKSNPVELHEPIYVDDGENQ